jgi:hypothetical protein
VGELRASNKRQRRLAVNGGFSNGHDYDELERGVFTILLDAPDGLPSKEVIRRPEKLVPPTDFENSSYPINPKGRRYEIRLRGPG